MEYIHGSTKTIGLDLAVRLTRIRPALLQGGYLDNSTCLRMEADYFGRMAFKPIDIPAIGIENSVIESDDAPYHCYGTCRKK